MTVLQAFIALMCFVMRTFPFAAAVVIRSANGNTFNVGNPYSIAVLLGMTFRSSGRSGRCTSFLFCLDLGTTRLDLLSHDSRVFKG